MNKYQLDDLEIFITDSVREIFVDHRQLKKDQPEAGGILLGQVHGKSIYILKASIPNKFDRSSRTGFECNRDVAQVLVNHEFANSARRTIYLGEWHTHPEDYPTPSEVDKEMIRDQFKKNKLNEPFVLLVIQGRKGLYLAKFNGKFKSVSIDE